MLKNIFSVKHLVNPRNRRTFALANKKYRGVEQLVARQAHNLEVVRSSRTPATKNQKPITASFFSASSIFPWVETISSYLISNRQPSKTIKCHRNSLYTLAFDNLHFTKCKYSP